MAAELPLEVRLPEGNGVETEGADKTEQEEPDSPLLAEEQEQEPKRLPTRQPSRQASRQASWITRQTSREPPRSPLTPSMISQRSQPREREKGRGGWDTVLRSIKSGAKQFAGLELSEKEQWHWECVQEHIQHHRVTSRSSSMQSLQPEPAGAGAGGPPPPIAHQPSTISTRSTTSAHGLTRREASLRHMVSRPGMSIRPTVPTIPEAGVGSAVPPSVARMLSEPSMVVRQRQGDKFTGRNQAVRTEVKPDLWKLAYKSIKKSIVQRRTEEEDEVEREPSGAPLKSFLDLGEEDDEDEENVDFDDMSPVAGDEDFFGSEIASAHPPTPPLDDKPLRDETDSPLARLEHHPVSIVPPTKPVGPEPTVERRRNRLGLPNIIYDPLFGGYDRGYGGLGLPSLLLRFKYIDLPQSVKKELDNALLHKRPYFTYWLTLVHIIIMITSLGVYGFAPYGWDLQMQQTQLQTSNLAISPVTRAMVPSIWGGPPQDALVLLGALYAPCMRTDRQLFNGIIADRQLEADKSGCCVRLDGSGCVQVLNEGESCPRRFARFVFNESDGETRAVCNTSPNTCTDPDPQFFAGWEQQDIRTWPICRNATETSTDEHLTCEITGRPCCFGIQAQCVITTPEYCSYLQGRFHDDAFLCSQVDCLNDICGLLPFNKINEPDQVYRLWLAFFLHAGIIHLVLSLLFTLLILRHVEKRLGWLRTAFLYIFSGIGGNLVSVYFAPYNPAVGPAACVLGIVAYFFLFILFEIRLLQRAWVEFLKLAGVTFVFILIGLLPYVDNFAHIGGFVFGLFLSCIVIQYKDFRKIVSGQNPVGTDPFWMIKIVLLIVGIVAVLLLFTLFFFMFYAVQDTWQGFSYLNCIPFTDTLCIDFRGLRIRNLVG